LVDGDTSPSGGPRASEGTRPREDHCAQSKMSTEFQLIYVATMPHLAKVVKRKVFKSRSS
jgi:hypothetical protein